MKEDQIKPFCAMLPNMDSQVAKIAFEKFPDFVRMSSGIMICFKEMVGNAMKNNVANMKSFNNSCDTIINSLNSLLLTVSGGTTFVEGSANSGNGALDYDGTASVTGGTFVAVGLREWR